MSNQVDNFGSEAGKSVTGSNDGKSSSIVSNKPPASVYSEDSKHSKKDALLDPYSDVDGGRFSPLESRVSIIKEKLETDKVPITEVPQEALRPVIEIEFQIREEEVSKSHKKYVAEHPEIHSFLSDYLQMLLHKKPENVYQFTNEYFRAD
ncbi:hypothetical protein HDV06_005045 [Boothiomyces sp. JEL0866]|nr:hypothetical protein HDV06_005045 [Boothiomyces sp. JEL0866]